MTIGAFLQTARSRLAHISETPGLDAQVLLSHVLDRPRTWLLAHPETCLSSDQSDHLETGLSQLISGVPLPYITGSREFYGMQFLLTQDVLIPRPETELLVETALEWLEDHPGRKRTLDVGTGSGCIAVSLAKSVPELSVTACDISAEALQVARKNASVHGVAGRVHFLESDLYSAVQGKYDLICSNPPYIPSAILRSLEVYQREPTLALDGGADGLVIIRRLVRHGRERLRKGGLMLVEIDSRHGPDARRLAEAAFPGAAVVVLPDLAGLDRCLRIEIPQ